MKTITCNRCRCSAKWSYSVPGIFSTSILPIREIDLCDKHARELADIISGFKTGTLNYDFSS